MSDLVANGNRWHMKLFRRLFHPLITFISIQILWILLLIFWIYWFLGRHQQFKELAARYQTEWLPDKADWLILTEGIVPKQNAVNFNVINSLLDCCIKRIKNFVEVF